MSLQRIFSRSTVSVLSATALALDAVGREDAGKFFLRIPSQYQYESQVNVQTHTLQEQAGWQFKK